MYGWLVYSEWTNRPNGSGAAWETVGTNIKPPFLPTIKLHFFLTFLRCRKVIFCTLIASDKYIWKGEMSTIFKTVLAWRLPVWRLSVFHLVIFLIAKVLAILNKDILGRGYAPSYDSGCIVCCIFSSGLHWRQEPGSYSWPFCLIRHDNHVYCLVNWVGMVSQQT